MAYGAAQSAYTTQTPSSSASFSSTATVRGNDFICAVAGRITGLRYYRHASATHTGRTLRLYHSTSALLGSCSTTGETGSGWKTASFAVPLDMVAGQRVRAVLEHPVGPSTTYSRSPNFTADIVNGDLTMLFGSFQGSTVGARPVAGDPNTFFVDVIFEAGAPDSNDLWVWNGTAEVPANVTVWNGAVEVAAGVSVT